MTSQSATVLTQQETFSFFSFRSLPLFPPGGGEGSRGGEGGSRVGGMEPNHRPSRLTVMPVPQPMSSAWSR